MNQYIKFVCLGNVVKLVLFVAFFGDYRGIIFIFSVAQTKMVIVQLLKQKMIISNCSIQSHFSNATVYNFFFSQVSITMKEKQVIQGRK